jgi:hypothetical protein
MPGRRFFTRTLTGRTLVCHFFSAVNSISNGSHRHPENSHCCFYLLPRQKQRQNKAFKIVAMNRGRTNGPCLSFRLIPVISRVTIRRRSCQRILGQIPSSFTSPHSWKRQATVRPPAISRLSADRPDHLFNPSRDKQDRHAKFGMSDIGRPNCPG